MNNKNLIRIIAFIIIIAIIIGIGILTTEKTDLNTLNNTNNIDNNNDIIIEYNSDINNNNNDSNITIIKADTYGEAYISSYDNKSRYKYFLEGEFKDLPENLEGYDLISTFYGNNGKFLHRHDPDISDIIEYPSLYSIGYWETYKLYNVTEIEVIIFNPDGETVFNQTYDFDMDRMDLSKLDKPLN